MGMLALILSIVGAVLALLTFVPALDIFKWIGGVVLIAGVVISIIGVGSDKKTIAVVGLIVSAVFLVFDVLRVIGLF